jgi:hypothetical protein
MQLSAHLSTGFPSGTRSLAIIIAALPSVLEERSQTWLISLVSACLKELNLDDLEKEAVLWLCSYWKGKPA